MNDEYKARLSKAKSNGKTLLVIIVTAVISAGGMLTYWLHIDNDRLEEQKALLEVRKQTLEAQLVELEADNLYLKEQALKENVFLTDRPQELP